MSTALKNHLSRASFEAKVEKASLRETLRRVPTPITFVAAVVDGRPVGMVVSSFVGISIEPALVGFYTQHCSGTWPALKKHLDRGGEIGVSVLGINFHGDVYSLAGPQEKRFDRNWNLAGDEAIILDGADSFIVGRADLIAEAGDHDYVQLSVERSFVGLNDSQALVFHDSRIGLVT